MKVQVVIEWDPDHRMWEWQILCTHRHEPSREIYWGHTLTRRGAQSKVATALDDLKHRCEEDERTLSRTIQFETEIRPRAVRNWLLSWRTTRWKGTRSPRVPAS